MSTVEVRSPYSGEVVGSVELLPREVVLATIERQAALVADRDRSLPAPQRIEVLRQAAALVTERRDALARQIAAEGGKPLTDALVEVDRAANGLDLCAEEVGHQAGEEIPMGITPASAGRLAFTTREPVGSVVAVSAFNHPLNLIVHQTGPAIAAGCPVLIKPAGPTPLSAVALGGIYAEAGLPADWCVVAPCDNDVAELAVTSDRIGFFSFIGVGPGGLDAALEAGPRCAGGARARRRGTPDRRRVGRPRQGGARHLEGRLLPRRPGVRVGPAGVRRRLDRRRTGRASRRRCRRPGGGRPTRDATTQMGPLIRQGEVERVDEWVGEARDGGAVVAAGGEPLDHQCYAPTLLVDPPDDSRMMTAEVFGPVVNVSRTSGLDDAVARANSLPWAFQAAVLAQDIDAALWAAKRLDATAVMLNDHTAFRVDWMPFGGRGPSGLGMGGMSHTVHELTRPKMIVLNAGA